MPVNTRHPEYSRLLPLWQQMRDFAEGEHAVHAAAEKYLPRLYKEPDDLYAARVARTGLFGATERTIEGLVGMLYRSTPECKVSPNAEKMLLDVTKSGEGVHQFGLKVAKEFETLGKVAVLTDYPQVPTSPDGKALTVKQVEEMNIRPNLARYTAESLINWEFGWVNNRTALTMAVLEEATTEPNPADPFMPKKVTQWRELRLVDGQYVVQLWRQTGAGNPEKHGSPIVPLMNGAPLSEIPLQIYDAGKPPLLALCQVNKSHYQSTSDLEQGAHRTAQPQPWAAGELTEVKPDGTVTKPELYIGGGELWTFPTGTQVGMLEYTGQGLQALEGRCTAKERQTAVLGARMLEAQKNGVEAADTAGMHRAGEQSILQQHAGDLSAGMEKSLGWFDRWAGGSGEVKYQVNKDFLPTMLTAQELTARVAAWQAGAISKEELFNGLVRGGVISEGADYETEEEKIANNPPVLAAPTPATPGGAGGGQE